MNLPQLFDTRAAGPDTRVFPASTPVPGFGVLAVNAFLIHARQPVLVDTGLAATRDAFLAALRAEIDPADLRWIWLTHLDADHTGALVALLAEAPRARVVTNYLGMGKMGLAGLPVERAYLLNPGQRLDVGDRDLVALRPPTFDAPETTGLFDSRTRSLFSADAFGALLSAPAEDAEAIPAEALREGLVGWGAVDSPWLHWVDESRWRAATDAVRQLAPERILSGHLPPARGMTDRLLAGLAQVRDVPAFTGPDQAALEAMMAAALKQAA